MLITPVDSVDNCQKSASDLGCQGAWFDRGADSGIVLSCPAGRTDLQRHDHLREDDRLAQPAATEARVDDARDLLLLERLVDVLERQPRREDLRQERAADGRFEAPDDLALLAGGVGLDQLQPPVCFRIEAQREQSNTTPAGTPFDAAATWANTAALGAGPVIAGGIGALANAATAGLQDKPTSDLDAYEAVRNDTAKQLESSANTTMATPAMPSSAR